MEGARSDLEPRCRTWTGPGPDLAQERRRRTDRQRAESARPGGSAGSIDRRLREQRRDLRRTHRLLLLGGCWSLAWGRKGARRTGRGEQGVRAEARETSAGRTRGEGRTRAGWMLASGSEQL